MIDPFREFAYFPGCSLATTAKENGHSLHIFFERFGIQLNELIDWNCCGSSSAHSTDHYLAEWLPARNLSLAPKGIPLLVACPSCFLRLKLTHMALAENKPARRRYAQMWGRKFDPELQIVTFFDLVSGMADKGAFNAYKTGLKGLKVACYYGCMLSRPPVMRHEKNFYGLMEKLLGSLGAETLRWNSATRCCGTFLTVSRPDIAVRTIQNIISDAESAKTECIVTACAMCQMNLEIRSKLPGKTPVFHFSELLSLAFGVGSGMGWFRRHLIDPRPLLRSKRLIP
ncbi:MAG: heterodisulfide reductase-related iron-sulfur binding cluster [Desulfobacteraceae bacterium]|nr:heterodisulfide reductase-related iron-sulfur binding cluster [Desulfobacteraceae bacterium]